MSMPVRRRRAPAVVAPRHHRRASALLAILALLLAAAPAAAPAARHRGPSIGVRLQRAVAGGINRFRAQHGLPPLRLDARMSRGAGRHSRSMARYHYFAHDSPSGSWARRVRSASHASLVGENLAYLRHVSLRRQAHLVVSMWVHSPPHRAVMLTRGFRRLGVGRATSGHTTFFTADFASRR